MSDFLRTRDAGKTPATQEQVDALMANEPDRLPYAGAGSMLAHLKRGSRQHRPTDARARMTEAERQQFAKENPEEPIPTSPEDRARIEAIVAENVKLYEAKHFFATAVRKRISLDDAWGKLGQKGGCPALEDFERDGDPMGAPEKQKIAALQAFANSKLFAAYRSEDRGSERYKLQSQIVSLLCDFMSDNLVNMVLAQSYVASFNLLNSLNLIPAPIKTGEQIQAARQAAERNKPAQDGGPVALHEDGTPVTYKFRDGRVIRYSQAMLDSLNSESFAKVMGLQRVATDNPVVRKQVEQSEQSEPEMINGKRVSDMSADEYRLAIGLRKGLNVRS